MLLLMIVILSEEELALELTQLHLVENANAMTDGSALLLQQKLAQIQVPISPICLMETSKPVVELVLLEPVVCLVEAFILALQMEPM